GLLLLTVTSLSVAAQSDAAETERPLLMAHYMPWYQTPDVSGVWGWHWTMDHFDPEQGEFASHFMPLTGVYDSQDEAILEYQVLLMKLSGIDGVIVDWYGEHDFADYAAINASTNKLFEMIKRAGLRFIICYEDRTLIAMTDAGYVTDENAVAHGTEVMHYLQDTWFTDDAYVKFNGQPLLFSYGPLYFRDSNQWDVMLADIEPKPALVTLDNYLSFYALSNFPWPPMTLAGGFEMPREVLDDYLARFYRNARRRDLVIGTAFPSFYDIYEEAGVRTSYGYIDANDGETLQYTLGKALEANASIIQLATWNDYGEGTTIEPTEEYGYQYLEIIQSTRQTLDAAFSADPDALRLPLQLLELRRAHADDAEVNAALDEVFSAIVSGDLTAAREIIASYS
ncbi:MAG: glycoside hydrolase family 71/99-like protein, partial [Chloroflexota bacterium]